jgi:serine/threonine protein kinase/Tfp pilus assembly protein PilF
MIGQTILHYKITEKLGEGGMGVVYRATDTKLDRPVAIKFLPSHLANLEENRKRFVQEAKATAALNHPNILAVYDIDKHDDSYFMVMEFVEGEVLKSYLGSGQSLSFEKATDWILQAAKGLKAAHDKNIVHRDIKSENLMINNNGQVKIMDFGLAKLKSNTGITRTGTSLGTLSYMSPEQAQGISADHRSDIWSLGVVFYEMLTGELPFKSEHEAGLIYVISNDDFTPTSALDRRIPPRIDQIIDRMMRKNRDERYQSLDEFISELENIKENIKNTIQKTKKKAITVLPFDNISPDKESDYFSDGLTDEIIANLARLKDMRVVSRTTSIQYKKTQKDIKTIGRELGARYIMEGSVRKFQDNLRITTQLIDVETDEQLWAGTYKGTLADVFDIQEQVSKQIVDALMVKLSPTEKVVLTKRSTLNPEAFDYYLRAWDFLYRFNKNNLHFAIQLFQKAIELDPRYADAYAGLAHSYATFYQLFDRNESYLDKASELSLKALMYDNSLPDAYSALGFAYYNKGSFDEGITACKKAIELDTNNFFGYWVLGRIYVAIDKPRDAVEFFTKVVELNPDFYTIYGDLQTAYGRLDNKEKYKEILNLGLKVYAKYLSQHPDDARAHMYFATDLAQIGKIEKSKAEAKKALELSPGDPLMFYNAGCFYSQLGEKKLAIDSIKNALASGFSELEWLKRDIDLENIRDEPEFVELVKTAKQK